MCVSGLNGSNGHGPHEQPEKSAAAEILQYEREVNAALKSLKRRTDYQVPDAKTPLSELMATDEGALDEWGVRNETVRRLLIYLAQDGPDPRDVMRNLYAVGAHMGVAPFCELTLRERGLMLGSSHGGQHWRTQRLCVARCGGRGANRSWRRGRRGAPRARRRRRRRRGIRTGRREVPGKTKGRKG